MRQVKVTLPDESQVLVTLWPSGSVEVDVREDSDGATLWRPADLVGATVEVVEVAA